MPSAEAIFKQILAKRGQSAATAKRFISPKLERDLHDPLLLPDMKPALKRIIKAKNQDELVVIYGDYDIDGLCATALLMRVFKHLGIRAQSYIPDRFEQGYGLNKSALAEIIKYGAALVITVDCGSNSLVEIAWAKQHGLDMIVTDHHELGAKLPPAIAVINPKRSGHSYPNRELAGSGVAFKLVQGLQTVTNELKAGSERWLLDYVAFATVCDVVPLTGENRSLAYFGLKLWPKTRWPGLKALIQTTGVYAKQINSTTLGFIFGPRLNAAGRLEHANLSLQLLLADDFKTGINIANKLEELNTLRRLEQDKIERGVINLLDKYKADPVLVLADKDWSHGVVGIVASKIMNLSAKPTFLLQLMPDGKAKGSARSFGGFSIADALQFHKPLLISGGGHAAAGGLSLEAKTLGKFRRAMINYYRSLKLPNQAGLLKIQPDVELENLSGVDLELVGLINQLQPFGQGNSTPIIKIKNLMVLSCRAIGQSGRHAKLRLADLSGHQIEAVMFNPNSRPNEMDQIDVLAEVNINDYGGQQRVQLIIQEWTPISELPVYP
jgi:single-stranded-DNA-specific exonuclease